MLPLAKMSNVQQVVKGQQVENIIVGAERMPLLESSLPRRVLESPASAAPLRLV
jgi:hypothetical protein